MITKEVVKNMNQDELACFVDEVDQGTYNGKSLMDSYSIDEYKQIMECYHYAIELAMDNGWNI